MYITQQWTTVAAWRNPKKGSRKRRNKRLRCKCPVAVRTPDGKAVGANMEPIWGRHVGPINFAFWDPLLTFTFYGDWKV